MTKLRIVLADDHRVFRAGLTLLINTQPDMEVVGEASDGEEALQKVLHLLPDVVLMDVSMPTVDGADATERLRHLSPSTKVLVLTAYEEGSRIRQLLRAGASGYLLKRVAADELTRAIRTVAAGGTYLDPEVASRVVDGYLNQALPPLDAPPLSERETDVLQHIAWGYSNKEIAAHLGVSVKTVETYKTRLMDKLRLHSRVDLVRYAAQQGWLRDL